MSRSPFDELKHVRLDNWGRWGRQDSDRPDPNVSSHTSSYLHDEEDEGWGHQGAIDAADVPIDHRDADYLDGFIRALPQAHREAIRCKFYRRKETNPLTLDAAIRCLLDRITQDRPFVRRMANLCG